MELPLNRVRAVITYALGPGPHWSLSLRDVRTGKTVFTAKTKLKVVMQLVNEGYAVFADNASARKAEHELHQAVFGSGASLHKEEG